MVEFVDNLYVFVIDTDKYAGNFERDLCGFITGKAGDYDFEMIGVYRKEMGLDPDGDDYNEYVIDIIGEHGLTPCTIWPTPDCKGYNSVAIFMDRPPTDEEVQLLMKRTYIFCEKNDIVVEGFRLLRRQTSEKIVGIWP